MIPMLRCLALPALLLATGCADLQALLETDGSSGSRQATPGGAQERDLYLDLIAGLQEKNMHRASLAHLDEYDQRFSALPRATRLRAEAYTAVGPESEGVAAWERLLGTSDEAAARNGLGRIAAQSGRWSEAAASFQEAVRREPTNARYVNNLGYALLRAGDRPGALFRLLQAEELDAGNAEIRRNVVLALMANGRMPDAEARLGRIADANERNTLRREAGRAIAALPGSGAPSPLLVPASETRR